MRSARLRPRIAEVAPCIHASGASGRVAAARGEAAAGAALGGRPPPEAAAAVQALAEGEVLVDGVNVRDLEVATMPVTRFAVARPESDAGISIRLDSDDPQSVVIRFFDAKGADITEGAQRKIERLFLREDFRRVFPGEIGDIGFPPRHLELYSTALEAAVDVERVATAAGREPPARLRARAAAAREPPPSSQPPSPPSFGSTVMPASANPCL